MRWGEMCEYDLIANSGQSLTKSYVTLTFKTRTRDRSLHVALSLNKYIVECSNERNKVIDRTNG